MADTQTILPNTEILKIALRGASGESITLAAQTTVLNKLASLPGKRVNRGPEPIAAPALCA